MSRDEEALRLLAASSSPEAPARPKPGNGRRKKQPDPVDEMLASPATTTPPEKPEAVPEDGRTKCVYGITDSVGRGSHEVVFEFNGDNASVKISPVDKGGL